VVLSLIFESQVVRRNKQIQLQQWHQHKMKKNSQNFQVDFIILPAKLDHQLNKTKGSCSFAKQPLQVARSSLFVSQGAFETCLFIGNKGLQCRNKGSKQAIQKTRGEGIK
jgi:hypothetical protein